MRELKYPAIYKHFKGKYYATMGESTPISARCMNKLCNKNKTKSIKLIKFIATKTESEFCEKIIIFEIDNLLYHMEDECDGILVLYKSLYDGTGAYARPKTMFMSEVDKDVYKDAKQKYRFELVEG